MNKEQESKQKRKTPLTTIAISQEYAQKLDEYIKGFALTRKDFVELAIDYFLRTGFDIRGEAFDLSPLERITNRLESSAKIMEQLNEGTEVMRQLLQVVREQTARQLPAPELIAHAAEEKAKAEAKSEEQEREIARLRSENSALLEYKEKAHRELCRVRDEQRTFGKIHVNTEL
ncbi:BfmA/BtgA family mobilization protein [Parabacteroides distasonis]|uniref:BfmA/BtgA family mobilization protein n=1 Tax=Parabacteroides distasonis TaxID=823 RepID=UPI00233EAEF5|nr:BfmA/BtgA family mobilization protein [Phocaeicola vulgatus]